MLYQQSYEATQLGVGQFVGLMCSRERNNQWKKCIFEVWVMDELNRSGNTYKFSDLLPTVWLHSSVGRALNRHRRDSIRIPLKSPEFSSVSTTSQKQRYCLNCADIKAQGSLQWISISATKMWAWNDGDFPTTPTWLWCLHPSCWNFDCSHSPDQGICYFKCLWWCERQLIGDTNYYGSHESIFLKWNFTHNAR